MRIVSLVPSLTELLIDLELHDQLVGRTRFCELPVQKIKDIQIIGGTKNPNIDKIKKINPDIILANKEENRKEDIDELRDFTHVHLTDIQNVEEALASMHEIGKFFGKEKQAHNLCLTIEHELKDIPIVNSLNAAYFIWREPWMSVGGDTYINDVMRLWSLENIFSTESRYPIISMDELSANEPDLVLLSSEPFPFKEKHVKEINKICPNSTVVLINGQWFSWYGSRMLKAFSALNKWRDEIE